MSLRKHLARRYITPSTKWKMVPKGVGKSIEPYMMSSRKWSLLGETIGSRSVQGWYGFWETLKEKFHLGDTIEDIAFAMNIDHKVFGIKATVSEKDDKKIVYHCYQYAWRKYFEPKLCIAIGQAEKGIVQVINPSAKYHILQTRTMGREKCIIKIEA